MLALIIADCSAQTVIIPNPPDALITVDGNPYIVSLDVKGDEGDRNTGTLVRSLDLEAAIETSITKSGVFSKVIQGSGANYRLMVEADATATDAGFNMTVTMGGTWRLIKVSTNKVVMDEFVTMSLTATVCDAFSGRTRVKLAIGGRRRNSSKKECDVWQN